MVADKDALFGRVYQSLKSGGRFVFTTCNGAPFYVWPPVANKCVTELFGPHYLEYLYHKRMSYLTCGHYQELAAPHGFKVTSLEDKDVSGFRTESVDILIAFFFGVMHGELDREAIGEQTINEFRKKYDNLRREAELHQTARMLHVVLTKP